MTKWLALFTLGAFCTLSSYSCARDANCMTHHMHNPAPLWPNERAAIIADIFNIAPEDVDQPIRIFTGN